MAYGYNSQIIISLDQESLFANTQHNIVSQFGQTDANIFTDIFIVSINQMVAQAISVWGGNLSYVRTTDATNAYYTFTWSDIIDDPSTNPIGSPTAFITIRYYDDGSFSYHTGAVCAEVPPPPADLTICTECRQSNQQACGETYFIEAGLTSGDTYYAAITDRNNDVYIQAIIADANGDLTIDATAPEFPVGFWLAESGNKSITVYEDEEMTIVSDLTVGANVYTCMILTLQYMYTTTSGLIPDFAFYVSDTLDFYVDNSSNTYIA